MLNAWLILCPDRNKDLTTMSKEFHDCGLNKLCRVCGENIKGWKKEVSIYLLELKEVLSGVNFNNDVEYIKFPQLACVHL